MSIRKYTNPREIDLSRGLQQVLHSNGMQAHISMQPDGSYQLIALGHDSPVMRYNITPKQVENLMNWGSNYANKSAYNTFTSIVRSDFDMPDNFVSARNARGKVVMGLHGYRIGNGEYGYHRMGIPFFRPLNRLTRGWGGDFLGWSPREQPGFHMRRIGGRLFMQDGPFVPERPDGRMKPGELRSGGYGFYYKGNQKETTQKVLDDIVKDVKVQPLEAAPRPQGQAIPYSELISKKEATTLNSFSVDSLQEVLKSHGIIVDPEKKSLTIQSNPTRVDLKYELTDSELNRILASDIYGKNAVSMDERLKIINDVVKCDFKTPITFDMLESRNLIDIELKDEVKADVEGKFIERDLEIQAQAERRAENEKYQAAARMENNRLAEVSERISRDSHAINGRDIHELMGNYGFFNSAAHGRDVVVGEIRVDETAGKHHIMSAEINGTVVTHSISKKDYDKFLQLDDRYRMKLFDDIFGEIKIRHDNGGRDMYESPVLKDVNTGEFITREQADIDNSRSSSVDGSVLAELRDSKGFYREIDHGREVEVGAINVDKVADDKYRMTAVIDGIEVSHEISQKQYEKFLAVDDYQRLKLFSKLFPEVDMKIRPGMGTNIGAALLAALVVGTEVAHDVVGIVGDVHEEHHIAPSIGTVYSKPGVVSPGEVLQHNFNKEMEMAMGTDDLNVHRGM